MEYEIHVTVYYYKFICVMSLCIHLKFVTDVLMHVRECIVDLARNAFLHSVDLVIWLCFFYSEHF